MPFVVFPKNSNMLALLFIFSLFSHVSKPNSSQPDKPHTNTPQTIIEKLVDFLLLSETREKSGGFTKDTLVKTPTGYTKIQNLKVGSLVVTLDETTNTLCHEIEFDESWRKRTLNESRAICQEQLSWSRKSKAQKRQARQTLLQAESALSQQVYLERSRLQKLRINADNILKQEIIRINNKIQNITSRIYHTSPTWNQAQKSFWRG